MHLKSLNGGASRKRNRTNNYFKTLGGRQLFFFDCTDTTSIRTAYDAAAAYGVPFFVWRPFPMAGPWFGGHIIGFTVGEEHKKLVSKAWDDTLRVLM